MSLEGVVFSKERRRDYDLLNGKRSKDVWYDNVPHRSAAAFVKHWDELIQVNTRSADLDNPQRNERPLPRTVANLVKQMLEAYDPTVTCLDDDAELHHLRFVWCEHAGDAGSWRLLADVYRGKSATMWIGKKSFQRVYDTLKAEQLGAASPQETDRARKRALYDIARRCVNKQHERYEDDDLCASCFQADPGKLQCDHFPLGFIDLWNDFQGAHPGGRARLWRDKDRPGTRGWRDSWRAYHALYAKYQPLCRACHAAKTAEDCYLRNF